MKLVAKNLKKENILGYKEHMKWVEAKKENNEILMMVNEKQINEYAVDSWSVDSEGLFVKFQ